MHIAGGELELIKSSYALMAWKLKKGKEEMTTIEESPGTLSLRSEKYKGMTVKLRRNEVVTAERQLGVRLAMSGHDDDEYIYRLEQSKTLAGKIHSSPFSRNAAEIIYRESWLSSVGYYLPITQFDAKQCKTIQSPFFNAILPNMGFN